MADGPRCKRRKQANPKRNSVTNFTNGVEASSDSDDEDKLHIVEEDSLQEPEGAEQDGATPNHAPQKAQNGTCNGVKDECSGEEDEEEEEGKQALVEEMLQQGDTAIIYPEAPEDEHSTPERGGADENGTPDAFSQLHTCPYCSRGYKRNASLKEHIKYRHEKSEDNYCCSLCTYTFTYRTQLERHMSQHKNTREQRHVTAATGGNRKFKCTECAKAFKYKHHLKEHLRIHSGEKPYECANCKKRFSHSGSYSSHISSKKCMGMVPPNGVPRPPIKPAPPPTQPSPAPQTRAALKEKAEGKPLQEQLPVTQIKSEPVEYECKPAPAAPAPTAGTNGLVNGSGVQATVAPTLPQGVAMVVPTVGLMSPISINLSDLQNVLKVAMDGNVLRQVLGTANGVVTPGKQGIVVQQPQQQIISLPAFVDQDGTTKIIINYSLNPTTTATAQPTPLLLKKDVPPPAPPLAAATTTTTAAAAITTTAPTMGVEPMGEVEKIPTDLSIVKTEPPELEPVTVVDPAVKVKPEMDPDQTVNLREEDMPKANSTSTCLLCDDCPDGLEALHLLQHRKAANGEAVDSAALDPSFAALLSEAGVTLEEPPVDDLLSLLKTYFASNADPSEEELSDISKSVSISVDVVKKWFAKMKAGKTTAKPNDSTPTSATPQPMVSTLEATPYQNGEPESQMEPAPETQATMLSSEPVNLAESQTDSSSLNATTGDLIVVKCEQEDVEDQDSQAEPLDLSLPKQMLSGSSTPVAAKPQEQPLNLSCLRKDQLQGGTIYVATSQNGNPVNIVTAGQLPTLVAITGQGAVGCLNAINTTTKRTILIPQLTYTYTTTAGSTTGAKTVVLNGRKEKKQDSGSEGLSTVEEQNDSDSSSQPKKRRLENGVYPCDLCDKVFQKGSSLLRHKYEHTGKRPHECTICMKAFKHKHHLIEHSRLHSGEKPYQCDKCGKRFSHSGSYSQHMNHRYSYCKKDGSGSGSSPGLRRIQISNIESLQTSGAERTGSPDTGPPSESRTTTPPSQLDSDERESEEEEDEDDEAMCMDDIRVVEVDDGECDIYEGDEELEEADEEVKRGDEEEAGEGLGRGEMEEGEEERERRAGEELTEGGEEEEEEEGMVCEVVEVELGDGAEDEEEETEVKETSEGGDNVEAGAEEAQMDTCVTEDSGDVGPTDGETASGE